MLAFESNSQIREKEIPVSLISIQNTETIFLETSNADRKQENKTGQPLQIGYTQTVLLNTESNGEWTFIDSLDLKVWQISIKSELPAKLVFYFSNFEPGENGKLFAISENKKLFTGAFTKRSKSSQSEFAFPCDFSDSTIILQFETTSQSTDYNIVLTEIGIIEKNNLRTGFGASGDCEVNVNCTEEGDSWKFVKQGIARVLVKQGSSLFYCSGTLINNTLKDFTPYFLTANHCGDAATASDYNKWVFDFNYQAEGCENPTTEPDPSSIVGASLKASGATYSGSDFKLLELNQDVPADFEPFFNGWTLAEVIGSSGTCIHQPQGDIKKISTYTTSPISVDYDQEIPNSNANYWMVYWNETTNGHGVTEGGSSGSPLFDENGYIIGSLTGGRAFCDSPDEPDFFGKFYKSWQQNGTNNTKQLQPWLDPLDSGITSLEGMGMNDSLIKALFQADFMELNPGQRANFENLSFGRITQYKWYFEGGIPETSDQMNPGEILYNTYGSYDVRLIVSNQTTSDTLLLEDYISVKPFVYPNPSTGNFSLHFGNEIPVETTIQLFDCIGREIVIQHEIDGNVMWINTKPIQAGLYIIYISSSINSRMAKIMISR
jgi:PKD repeat protein